jgi:hypothetical protein
MLMLYDIKNYSTVYDLNIGHNTDTNAIGQSQPSGVNIHGNKYEVTVSEGQNGQIGADGSGGHAESGILPR